MALCDSDTCPRPDEHVDENTAHYFAGYGFLVRFHPECCPREFDGTTCDEPHPLGSWSNEPTDSLDDVVRAMKEVTERPIDYERRYVTHLEPVEFGTPTPEGRVAGDCRLCCGDEGLLRLPTSLHERSRRLRQVRGQESRR